MEQTAESAAADSDGLVCFLHLLGFVFPHFFWQVNQCCKVQPQFKAWQCDECEQRGEFIFRFSCSTFRPKHHLYGNRSAAVFMSPTWQRCGRRLSRTHCSLWWPRTQGRPWRAPVSCCWLRLLTSHAVFLRFGHTSLIPSIVDMEAFSFYQPPLKRKMQTHPGVIVPLEW